MANRVDFVFRLLDRASQPGRVIADVHDRIDNSLDRIGRNHALDRLATRLRRVTGTATAAATSLARVGVAAAAGRIGRGVGGGLGLVDAFAGGGSGGGGIGGSGIGFDDLLGGGGGFGPIGAAFSAASGPLRLVTGALSRIGSLLFDITRQAATFGTIAGGLLSAAFVKGVADIAIFEDRSRKAFGLLIGDAAEANSVYDETLRTARELGLGVESSVDSVRKLLAAQFDRGEANELLRMTADLQAIGVQGEETRRVLTALTQIRAKGRLQAEEMLQLAEAGISTQLVYEELEKKLGKTRDEVRKLQEQGKIGQDLALDAIREAVLKKTSVAVSGDAAKAFADETLLGQLNQLKSIGQLKLRDIAVAAAPEFDRLRDTIAETREFIDGVDESRFADFFGAVTTLAGKAFQTITTGADSFGLHDTSSVPVKLNVTNHDRDSANFTYVYPVVSRRAGGVSIGLNLNPNNACNFRCIYCQVPELTLGKGPEISLPQFEAELGAMLEHVLHGDFMQTRVPEGSRRLNDLAFSGNGEPTSSPQFAECVERVGAFMQQYDLLSGTKLVLITNGSLTDRAAVEPALARMAEFNGEIWFKLDSGTQAGAERINQSRAKLGDRLARLVRVSHVCPIWVQTCLFAIYGLAPSETEREAYLSALSQVLQDGAKLQGVLLYGLARPSMQPEAAKLSALSEEWLEAFAERIRALGLPVKVSV